MRCTGGAMNRPGENDGDRKVNGDIFAVGVNVMDDTEGFFHHCRRLVARAEKVNALGITATQHHSS